MHQRTSLPRHGQVNHKQQPKPHACARACNWMLTDGEQLGCLLCATMHTMHLHSIRQLYYDAHNTARLEEMHSLHSPATGCEGCWGLRVPDAPRDGSQCMHACLTL
jgi:hypothetical protein